VALPSSAAFGHIDLLTVVMHELGHVLGLSDEDTITHTHLMSATLDTGVRRLPETLPTVSSAMAPRPAMTPRPPEVRHLEWETKVPRPAALVFDAGTGPLAPVPASHAAPPARRHAPRIVWDSAGAEARVVEDVPLMQGSWWRRLQRLCRHDQHAR
jgi:hypothetical protein